MQAEGSSPLTGVDGDSRTATRRGLEGLAGLLDEWVMGFLALTALSAGLLPELFTVSADGERILALVGWTVVALFGIEYVVNMVLATDRAAYVRNPWRMFDLAVILVSLASVLPAASDVLRQAPVLRLLRLGRALLFGARATSVGVQSRRPVAPELMPSGPPLVHVLQPGAVDRPEPGTWREFLDRIVAPASVWYDASGIGPEQLMEIVEAGIPAPLFEPGLSDLSYPHVQESGRFSSLFAWLPSEPRHRGGRGPRHGVLLVSDGVMLLTLSRSETDTQAAVSAALLSLEIPGDSFVSRTTVAFLHVVVDRYENVVSRLERQLRSLEERPVFESGDDFFERAFELRSELAQVRADLWRLKSLLSSLAESKRTLPGLGPPQRSMIEGLADEAGYLYETVDNVREGALSLIDLHINVVSFEMNKVMRVLAVASVLAIVPAVIGGLFGVNTVDNPFAFTLPQITFGVAIGMIAALYVFLAKGWLR